MFGFEETKFEETAQPDSSQDLYGNVDTNDGQDLQQADGARQGLFICFSWSIQSPLSRTLFECVRVCLACDLLYSRLVMIHDTITHSHLLCLLHLHLSTSTPILFLALQPATCLRLTLASG